MIASNKWNVERWLIGCYANIYTKTDWNGILLAINSCPEEGMQAIGPPASSQKEIYTPNHTFSRKMDSANNMNELMRHFSQVKSPNEEATQPAPWSRDTELKTQLNHITTPESPQHMFLVLHEVCEIYYVAI